MGHSFIGIVGEEIFKKFVDNSYREKRYRPDIIMVLYRKNFIGGLEFLVEESARSNGQKNFIQEGAEMSDLYLEDTLKRGLKEVGIKLEEITNIHFIGLDYVDLPHERNKRGFSDGKAYFVLAMEYIGNGKIKPDGNEVAGARFYNWKESIEWIKTKDMKKGILLYEALHKVKEGFKDYVLQR